MKLYLLETRNCFFFFKLLYHVDVLLFLILFEIFVIISCRFRVVIEMIKPERLDGSTTIKGLQYIDVPGQMKKDYKVDFFAHKEGTFSAKVLDCFLNFCSKLPI